MVTDIIIGLAVLGLLIWRQVTPRPVKSSATRMFAILGVIGVLEAAQFLQKTHAGAKDYVALAGSLVLAAGFGAARASLARVWLKDGQPWTQGSWLTAVLWAVALAAHLGFDYLVAPHGGNNDVGTATVVLYLAVSLGVQRLITVQRAAKLTGVGTAGMRPLGNGVR